MHVYLVVVVDTHKKRSTALVLMLEGVGRTVLWKVNWSCQPYRC